MRTGKQAHKFKKRKFIIIFKKSFKTAKFSYLKRRDTDKLRTNLTIYPSFGYSVMILLHCIETRRDSKNQTQNPSRKTKVAVKYLKINPATKLQ